jgi:hypothetical protein
MKKDQQKDNKVQYKLLDDNPAKQDKFGAHARIANAIATLIRSNDGGKTIALFGEWGSGKSTTIKLLERNLDSSYKIFTYDAWVHSGDHLRKAFLNEFIDSLVENKWLIDDKKDGDYWKQQKEMLAGRLKVTTKKTEPEFSKHGKILIPFILALPIATVIFNNFIQGYIKDQYFFTPYHISILILTVISFFIICFPFGYILWHLCQNKGNSSKVLSLILNKATLEETTTSFEQPEATTIEFQEIFKNVMSTALQTKGGEVFRNIIIVIDNLDRLDQEEAKTIWSLLRGFIDNPSYKNPKGGDNWLNNIWVIVPLASIQNQQNSENDGSESLTKKINIDEQFLEKVFQVRFHLPPPVQSDWRIYLKSQLKETFPSENDRQYSLIIRLYENFILELTPQKGLPTPRELTLFINDLIVLALQWRDHFDLASCAAYILSLKVANGNFLKSLRFGMIPSNNVKRILREDPTNKFAAFYFNIDDTTKAHTVLLTPIIEQVLKDKDSTTLASIIKNNPNSKDVLENVIDSTLLSWAQDLPKSFFNAILTVEKISEERNSEGVYLLSSDIKEMLVEKTNEALIHQFKAFPILIENSVEAITSIVKIQTDITLTETVVNSVKRISKLAHYENEGLYPKLDEADEKVTWVTRLKELYENKAINSGFNELEANSILLPISFNGWITVLINFKESKDFLRIIYPQTGKQIIKEGIAKAISSATYDNNYFHILNREIEDDSKGIVDDFVAKAKTSIASGRVDASNKNLIEDLILLRDESIEIDNLLLESSDKGYLGHMFFEAQRAGLTHLMTTFLLSILIKNPELVQHPGLSYSANGIQTISSMMQSPTSHTGIFDELIEQIELHGEYRILIDLAINNPNSSTLLQYLLPKIKDVNLIYEKFDLEKLPGELEAYLKRVYPDDKSGIYQKVVDYFIDKKELIKFLITTEHSLDNAKLLCHVLLSKKPKDKSLTKHLIKLLKTLNKDTWLKNIVTYTWIYYLVILIVNTNIKVELNLPLRQALYELMKMTEVEVISAGITKGNMIKLQQALSDSQRNNFAEDVYEFAAQSERKLTESFWRLFGDILEEATITLGNTGRPIRRLLKPIVSKLDVNGIHWTVNLLQKKKLSLLDEDIASKKDLKATLNSLLKDTDERDDIYPHLKDLASMLNKK